MAMKKLLLVIVLTVAVLALLGCNTTADSTVSQRCINAESQYEANKAVLGETAAWYLRKQA
ncbi:hypothetical protein [Phascolarctobacterium faecium]|jgi:uncharacterized lipoprotein NlpE involved in copper resistance|uniref:hypothetical protein n=1 Tax=Phascolarctobacterium faecium TaxID=33025 RepID=UPI0039F5360E